MERTPNSSLIPQLCLLLSVLSGVLLGVVTFRYLHHEEVATQSHIAQALDQIRDHYVEDIDEDTLAQGAIDGMLGQLDNYSVLLNASQFAQLRQESEGAFSGVGIEIERRDDTFEIIALISDSPAFHAGIKTGDRLQAVDDMPTANLDMNQLISRVKGEPGTAVKLTLLRENFPQALSIRVVRSQLTVASATVRRLEDGVVHARLTKFQQRTADELASALTRLNNDSPVRGLILDLRNNPGGLLSSAIAVADLFLQRGVIVTTRKRRGKSAQQHFRATLGDILPGRPIAVLINGGSASAAEVVAAALRDHRRATLVGARSFGKGSVQTLMPTLGLRQTIKLTTAEYFSPQGLAINNVGVDPDVLIKEASAAANTDLWLDAAIAALKHMDLGVEQRLSGTD